VLAGAAKAAAAALGRVCGAIGLVGTRRRRADGTPMGRIPWAREGGVASLGSGLLVELRVRG